MGKKSAKIRGKILVNEMPKKTEKRLKLLKKNMARKCQKNGLNVSKNRLEMGPKWFRNQFKI